MNPRTILLTAAALLLPAACGGARERPERPLLSLAPAPDVRGDTGGLAAADVNGDGRTDLVAVIAGRLSVFFSDGEGFKPAAGTPLSLADHASDVAVADFNRDGKHDLALASHDSYAVAVLLGDGAGRFTPAPGSPFASKRGTRPHTHGLAVGDFDRDGNVDVVTANTSDRDVSLLLGDGRGGFAPSPHSPFPCGPGAYPIAVADLDRDGNADVLVPNSVHADAGIRTLTVLRGDGAGRLAPAPGSPVAVAGGAFFVTAADVNADGAPDAVVSHNNDDRATILLNDGRGGLSPAPGSPMRLGHNCWCVAVADMDGDGTGDLVAAGGDAVRVFVGDGKGRFAPGAGSPYAAGKGTWRFVLGDFNADRRPDVAATCVEERRLAVLLGR